MSWAKVKLWMDFCHHLHDSVPLLPPSFGLDYIVQCSGAAPLAWAAHECWHSQARVIAHAASDRQAIFQVSVLKPMLAYGMASAVLGLSLLDRSALFDRLPSYNALKVGAFSGGLHAVSPTRTEGDRGLLNYM